MYFEETLSKKRETYRELIRAEDYRKLKQQMRQRFRQEIQIPDLKQLQQNQSYIEIIINNYQLTRSFQFVIMLSDIFNQNDKCILKYIEMFGKHIAYIGIQNINNKEGRHILGNLSMFKQTKNYLLQNNFISIVLNQIMKNISMQEVVIQLVWILSKFSAEIEKDKCFMEITKYYSILYQNLHINKHFVQLIYNLSLKVQLMPDNDLLIKIIQEASQINIKAIRLISFQLCMNFVLLKSVTDLLSHYRIIFRIYLETVSIKNDTYINQRGFKMLQILINKIGIQMIELLLNQDYFNDLIGCFPFYKNSTKEIIFDMFRVLIANSSNNQIYRILQNQYFIEILILSIQSNFSNLIEKSLTIIETLLNTEKNKYENSILILFMKLYNFKGIIENLCQHTAPQISELANHIYKQYLEGMYE